MPGKESISKKVSVCATCDRWRGDQRWPTRDRLEVIYETLQRGVCTGPLETNKSKTPRNKCRAWKLWQKINMPYLEPVKEKVFVQRSQTYNLVDNTNIYTTDNMGKGPDDAGNKA